MTDRCYIAIDLKSFYASVECVERGLDPLTTNLVVADESRSQKTICLAVSPALKEFGIPGRPRLFEVTQKLDELNAQRRFDAPGRRLTGESTNAPELRSNPSLAIAHLTAVPRMALYIERSTQIYEIYLRHVAPEDIHVYSIDEVFIDATGYLKMAGTDARGFAMMLVREVLAETGITATAGIGTNLYLAKIAMDIVAKHIPADENGVRIAELDEMSYRRKLWEHQPLTDFWRVGRGIARRLEENGLHTMGDVARCSIGDAGAYHNEDLLYDLFGKNAELLIDHAWGWEPCTMAAIKAYRPESNSMGAGQVLMKPYPYDKARLVLREMAEQLSLDLLERGLVTNQIVITVNYDRTSLSNSEEAEAFDGEMSTDWYGRKAPKPAHGTRDLPRWTSSMKLIVEAAVGLFDEIADERLLARRLGITACDVVRESDVSQSELDGTAGEQGNLFDDSDTREKKRMEEDALLDKERRAQEAMLAARQKFGRNAVLKAHDLQEDATARDRNQQIGGHRA